MLKKLSYTAQGAGLLPYKTPPISIARYAMQQEQEPLSKIPIRATARNEPVGHYDHEKS